MRDTGPIFAIGRSVLVNCAGTGQRVQLTDEKGITALGTLRDRTKVEILAWRQHGVGGPRYFVKSVDGSAEGWLSATNLRALPAGPIAATPTKPREPVVEPPRSSPTTTARPRRTAAKRTTRSAK
jgi:hypothetical protein